MNLISGTHNLCERREYAFPKKYKAVLLLLLLKYIMNIYIRQKFISLYSGAKKRKFIIKLLICSSVQIKNLTYH